MIGDTYLWHCLAGIDSNQALCLVYCHIILEAIEVGLHLCFGSIVDRFRGTGIEGHFLLFLVSIVYHANTFLLPCIAEN